jgi:hypothetical protein
MKSEGFSEHGMQLNRSYERFVQRDVAQQRLDTAIEFFEKLGFLHRLLGEIDEVLVWAQIRAFTSSGALISSSTTPQIDA